MQEIHICGKRGLGDIASTISNIIANYKKEGHYIFHYPPGFGYTQTIEDLMSEFIPVSGLQITFEVDETFYSIRPEVCNKKFGITNLNKTYFFSNSYNNTVNARMQTQWKGNQNGPIGLVNNYENWKSNYPYLEKFYPKELNDHINNLIDGVNYLTLGRPLTVAESIKKMAECRYIVGVDSAWAHISKCVNIPHYVVRNDLNKNLINKLHSNSTSVRIIETHDVLKFLSI